MKSIGRLTFFRGVYGIDLEHLQTCHMKSVCFSVLKFMVLYDHKFLRRHVPQNQTIIYHGYYRLRSVNLCDETKHEIKLQIWDFVLNSHLYLRALMNQSNSLLVNNVRRPKSVRESGNVIINKRLLITINIVPYIVSISQTSD